MSKIEWTGRTWNIVTGCAKVSPGCDRCYMYRDYPRLKAMNVPGYQASPEKVTILPERLNQPLEIKKPSMFFVCSMADLFHRDVPFEHIDAAWDVMKESAARHGHVFQILTKRPGRMLSWHRRLEAARPEATTPWPERIWAGTSVENANFQWRTAALSRLPAPMKFLSAEPLLGPLDISHELQAGLLQWVIAGGESGPGARPADLQWFRELRDQCAKAGVPYFLKQLGGARDKRSGAKAVLDGRIHQEFPEQDLK